MKKFFVFIMALVLSLSAFAFVGCSNNEDYGDAIAKREIDEISAIFEGIKNYTGAYTLVGSTTLEGSPETTLQTTITYDGVSCLYKTGDGEDLASMLVYSTPYEDGKFIQYVKFAESKVATIYENKADLLANGYKFPSVNFEMYFNLPQLFKNWIIGVDVDKMASATTEQGLIDALKSSVQETGQLVDGVFDIDFNFEIIGMSYGMQGEYNNYNITLRASASSGVVLDTNFTDYVSDSEFKFKVKDNKLCQIEYDFVQDMVIQGSGPSHIAGKNLFDITYEYDVNAVPNKYQLMNYTVIGE